MPASASARRYASAAFTVAGRTGEYDAWMQALAEVARILEMRSARTVFMSPAVPATQKAAALDRMLSNASLLPRYGVAGAVRVRAREKRKLERAARRSEARTTD